MILLRVLLGWYRRCGGNENNVTQITLIVSILKFWMPDTYGKIKHSPGFTLFLAW